MRPLYDDKILFNRQPVALVLAEEWEIARFAASLVRVEYKPEPFATDLFAQRDKASRELEKLGAEPALRKARGSRRSLEAHRRLDRILEKLSSHWLRSQRAIEALELAGTPATQRVLQTLAAGAAEARLTQEAKAVLKRWKRQRPAASS